MKTEKNYFTYYYLNMLFHTILHIFVKYYYIHEFQSNVNCNI